eukprot:928710-Rhodomonas_salina.1
MHHPMLTSRFVSQTRQRRSHGPWNGSGWHRGAVWSGSESRNNGAGSILGSRRRLHVGSGGRWGRQREVCRSEVERGSDVAVVRGYVRCVIVLGACSAMSGTDVGYALPGVIGGGAAELGLAPSCMALGLRYALSGIETAFPLPDGEREGCFLSC